MAQSAGYLVDLRGITLTETDSGTSTSWIHAMAPGTYSHPVYGQIEITLDRVRRFAQGVKDRVRGIDLDIDYDHKQRTGEAAGWVRNAEARSDGLWILVEWTREAAQKIKDKAYRYFSPEFADEWEHPEKKEKFQDVLLGGGITNRPFLKNLIPINLSEAFASEENTQGGQMDPKKLRELLGLPEDAKDELVMTTLSEKLSAGGPEDTSHNPPVPVALSEDIQKLVESNPAIKALAEQLEANNKQLAEQAAALRLGEVTTQMVQLTETARTKKLAVPPAVSEELKGVMLLAPKALSDKFLGVVTKLAETGFVSLTEEGENNPVVEGASGAAKKFGEAVAKVMSEEKLEYADAANVVADRDPALFEAYQNSSYSFKI